MTRKDYQSQSKRTPTIFIRGSGRRGFEVRRREPLAFGRLITTEKSRVQKGRLAVEDPETALRDWLGVLSRFRAWDAARSAKNMLSSAEELEAAGISTARMRQRAKNFTLLRSGFDQALKSCANQHGPLGTGGTEIDRIADALWDLELFATSDEPGLRAQMEPPGRDTTSGMRLDDRKACRRVGEAVTSCKVNSALSVDAPDLFSALACYIVIAQPRFGVCEVCRTLFIPRSAKKKTCSDRCRRRLSDQRQKAKRSQNRKRA